MPTTHTHTPGTYPDALTWDGSLPYEWTQLARSVYTNVVPMVTSPTNIVLFIILLYVAFLRLRPRSNAQPSVISDEPLVFTYYDPHELSAFDGKKNKRILMGIRGRVYDVTAGAHFYGPGGPYGNFAGRDASRGLSKGSFDEGICPWTFPSPCHLANGRYDYPVRSTYGSVGQHDSGGDESIGGLGRPFQGKPHPTNFSN
jgi:predicted heme/steroid binding protein